MNVKCHEFHRTSISQQRLSHHDALCDVCLPEHVLLKGTYIVRLSKILIIRYFGNCKQQTIRYTSTDCIDCTRYQSDGFQRAKVVGHLFNKQCKSLEIGNSLGSFLWSFSPTRFIIVHSFLFSFLSVILLSN